MMLLYHLQFRHLISVRFKDVVSYDGIYFRSLKPSIEARLEWIKVCIRILSLTLLGIKNIEISHVALYSVSLGFLS